MPADTSDDDYGAGERRAASAKPSSPATLTRRKQEVDLTRRSLVTMLAAAAAASPVAAQTVLSTALKAKPQPVIESTPAQVKLDTGSAALRIAPTVLPDQTAFDLLRPSDLVNIHFILENLVVTGQGKDRHIARVDASKPGLLIANLPPQAIAENTYPDPPAPEASTLPNIGKDGTKTGTKAPSASGKISATTKAETRIAGRTRLAFIMPDAMPVPFTVAGVLGACNSWQLNLDVRALDAPQDFAPAHSFGKMRARLAAVAKSYAKDLKAYGDGIVNLDPHKAGLTAYGSGAPAAEALLARCADLAAQAMADAAASPNPPSDADLDKLIATIISNEIDITVHPEDAIPGPTPTKLPLTGTAGPAVPSASFNGQQALTYQKAALQGYVNAQATRKLAAVAIKRNPYAIPGLKVVYTPVIPLFPDLTPRTIARSATDIEIPFRLHLSPTSTAGFVHATGPVHQKTPFTELWHTRLGTRVGDWVLPGQAEPMRALWSEDFDGSQSLPGSWALIAKDRKDLVNLTSTRLDSKPALANHLRLTAMGASLDIDGSWNAADRAAASNADVAGWKHVSSIGRDQYVRVIYDGFLFPFGHAASLIKISERKILPQAGGGYVAGLMQKFYIIVREPLRSFPHADQPFEGRDFPFATVEITTRQTPDLAAPTADLPAGFYSEPDSTFEGFWPRLAIDGNDMTFHTVLTDGAGNRTVLDMPMIFVSGSRNALPDKVAMVVTAYDGITAATTVRTHFTTPASLIRFSPPSGVRAEETDHHATALTFGARPSTSSTGFDAHFYPTIVKADVELRAMKALLGQKAGGTFAYHTDYIQHGFDAVKNAAELVMRTEQAVSVVHDATDRFGGMIAPDLNPDGLSRRFGALTNSAAYEGQKALDGVDPAMIVGNMQLFGIVPVNEILQAVKIVSDATDKADSAADQAKSLLDDPAQLANDIPGIPKGMVVDLGSALQTTYTFKATLGQYNLPVVDSPLFIPDVPGQPGAKAPFTLTTTAIVAKTAGAKSSITVAAKLDTFKINLFGFIAIRFDYLKLDVSPGQKTQVDPKLCDDDGVVFGGPLEFLNTLKSYIPAGGFVDPPGLDVTPQGITASYSLALPSISVGAMSLQNVSLGAGFDLPFIGSGPTARFNFAERQNPFNLTIALFGGGGFFVIGVGTEGVKELEAAIEFGAQVSIDLGVASGGVYVKGGFHFLWQADAHLIHLDAYVELGGHLDVLGLITVSLVFHLALNYEKQGSSSRLYGTATLTVEIDILFFSCSQDITVERQFAGSDSDPSFLAFVPEQSVWDDYCNAFAAAA